MSGFTNKLKAELLAAFFQGASAPASFFLALVTDATAPGPDTNTLADLTEIAAGNGYTAGGIAIAKNTTDFPTSTEDDANDKGIIGLKDIKFIANGGPIPASGNGARYAVLTGPGATVSSRKVYLWIDLVSARTVSDGQELRINGITAEMLQATG